MERIEEEGSILGKVVVLCPLGTPAYLQSGFFVQGLEWEQNFEVFTNEGASKACNSYTTWCACPAVYAFNSLCMFTIEDYECTR